MDKTFENMDNRFKNIEAELNYNYDSSHWSEVENEISNSELDHAFVNAAVSSSVIKGVDFNSVDDAFMNDAFQQATKQTQVNYNQAYFSDFKKTESTLVQNESFTTAAASSIATYQPKFWNDADKALQAEGLHHEYKSDYWKEAEQLLLKDQRKGFFLRWGLVATILLLVSFGAFQFNNGSISVIDNLG